MTIRIILFFGIFFAHLLLPKFNVLSGKQLTINSVFHPGSLGALLAVTLVVGLAAGSYPAVVLSAFSPVDILRRRQSPGGRNLFSKGLVVLQFSISIILAVTAIFLVNQVSLLVKKDPGYVSSGLVVVLTQEGEQAASEDIYQRFRTEALSNSRILGMSASNREFGLFLPSNGLERGGRRIGYHFNRVDSHFLSTLRIELLQGRDFSRNVSSDRDAIIVNQRFMEELGPDYVLGDSLGDVSKGFPYHCRIVGVMKNSHFQTMRNEINPLILYVGKGFNPSRDRFSRMFIRVEPDNMKASMGYLEDTWKKIQPEKPFIHYFQDERLEALYSRERRWGTILQFSSIFSVVLACLGIFGLTALTLNRRKKEIGIRKVLGAGVKQIVYLANREFVILISTANLVSWPVAYIIVRRILQDYPFRVEIGILYFILAGAASLLIAVVTILFLSIKAALADPVDSLKYE